MARYAVIPIDVHTGKRIGFMYIPCYTLRGAKRTAKRMNARYVQQANDSNFSWLNLRQKWVVAFAKTLKGYDEA